MQINSIAKDFYYARILVRLWNMWSMHMLSTDNGTAEKQDDAIANKQADSTKILGVFAAVAGFGAVLASSCCILPLLLAAVGASAGVFSAFQHLAEWRYALLGVASASLMGSWYAWWKKRQADCCSLTECAPNTRSITTTMLLILSTTLIVLALSWQYFEPLILKIIKGHI